MMNDVFLRALRREETEYTPVWLMRQAGRYLPEYNRTRARAGDFLTLCKTPELACEVTLQPLERFPLDAAILFSDILTIPDAMGLGLSFEAGEGPRFARPVRDEAAVDALPVPDPEQELRYVMDAVRTIRKALDGRVPLIGFSGSPWTLACYMIEGQGGTDFRQIKSMMFQRPELLSRLLETVTQAVIAYLDAQARAGAQALMIFDTWGGVLSHRHIGPFSLDFQQRIVAAMKERHPQVPIIVFTKGGAVWLEQLADTGADAVGVDWTIPLSEARSRIGGRCAVQGNLDPLALMASPEQVAAEARQVLHSWGRPQAGSGHVFNLGHGISQFTPPESVAALVQTVHDESRRMRGGRAAPVPGQ